MLLQVELFTEYLEKKHFMTKGKIVRGAVIERLKMPWRNEENKVDCGVYTMRHMETYMGQKVKDLKIGLKKNSTKQLRFLRGKYCKALLTSEVNDLNEDNIKNSATYYMLACEHGPVDVEKLVIEYVKKQDD